MSQEQAHTSMWQFGDWRIEPHLNRIRRDGETVQLEPRTMDVLAYFLTHPDVVVSFQELLDAFWEGRVADEGTIHRRVRQIRRVLGDDAREPRYIETIRKRGYRTLARVHEVKDHAGTSVDLMRTLERQTPPFPAYEGEDPYVFVCYAHEDRGLVYPEIIRLRGSGVHIWYDEGITPGGEWTEELARAIAGCDRFLYFVSPASVESTNCRDEVRYARETGKPMVTVYLKPTVLPDGLRLEISRIQALHKHQLLEEDYRRKISAALLSAMTTDREPPLQSFEHNLRSPRRAVPWRPLGLVASTVAILALILGAESGMEHFWGAGTSTAAVAVLPFRNLSADPSNRTGEGIPEEVRAGLKQVPGIRLISLEAKVTGDRPLADVIDDMDVGYVVEGSFRSTGNRIRVTARLVAVEDGGTLWAGVFEENVTDGFDEEIAIAVKAAKAVDLYFNGSTEKILPPIRFSPGDGHLPELQRLVEEAVEETEEAR